MKKRTLALIALLTALVAVYFLVFYNKSVEDNVFHVEDPTAIGKVELTKIVKGKEVSSIVLERGLENDWKVNSQYTATQAKAEEFVNMLSQIRVNQPIEEKGQNSALALLKRNHTRVKVHDREGSMLRDYLVGATNSKQTANIMMVYGADRAWLVSMPGREGYVSIFYTTELEAWREKLLFSLKGDDIRKIEVKYASNPGSFSLARADVDANWTLAEGFEAEPERVSNYLDLFKGKVFAESFADKLFPGMQDSLGRREPDVRISYEQLDGEKGGIRLFVRPENKNSFFGLVDGRAELYTVQHFVIDKYLKTIDYFQKTPL